MASQTYSQTPKVRLIWVSGELVLDPLNDEARVVMDQIFAADGADTTVAITQEDASRDGYAETDGAYKTLKFALSA